MILFKKIAIGCALTLASLSVFAHSGKTDANGCHTNSKTGEYHCHGGNSTPTPTPSNQPPSNSSPVASFTMSTNSGDAPLTVVLNASYSNDPDGNIVTYAWQTSDGQSVVGKEVGVTFVNAGTYTITLTVTDNNGKSASSDQIVTVKTVTSIPSTPTTPTTSSGNCMANYVPASGRLTIPCVTVPVTLPFGGSQVQNYTVEMQQRAGAFVFDLDLNTVKQQ
jgi:PKD repeat protein